MIGYEMDVKAISLSGYQVVTKKYFSRLTEPAMTLWKTSISFNCATYEAFNNCEAVEIYVNEKNRSIIIKPSSTQQEDAVNWRKDAKQYKYNRIECSMFTYQLYSAWGLSKDRHYRASGRMVQCEKKLMMLFDFSCPEIWEGSKLVKENG